jgi:hypothetical protein
MRRVGECLAQERGDCGLRLVQLRRFKNMPLGRPALTER